MSEEKNICCFIPEDQQEAAKRGEKVAGCPDKPEWRIVYGASSDDYTESCTAHVGPMLTDAPEHRIYPLEGLETLMP